MLNPQLSGSDEQQDITELLDQIAWGRRIVTVNNVDNVECTFVFRPLTLEERNMGNYVYSQEFKNGIRRGLSTREQLTKEAIYYGLWKFSYEKEAELLRQERKTLEEEIAKERKANKKRQTTSPKLIRLQRRLEPVVSGLEFIESSHAQYIELPSAEYRAECERGNYFLHCATLSFPDMDPVWPKLKDLHGEYDTTLVARLLRAYYEDTVATESQIRAVARSGFWRCKWIGSKKNRGVLTLFGREMHDLTVDQFRLVYWSQVYDSAFESLEAPPDHIVDDDKLFDEWLERQHQKHDQERKQSEFNQKISKYQNSSDKLEVGMNVQGYFCEECNCGVKGTDRVKLRHLHAPSCPYGVFLYYDQKTKLQKIDEVQSANPDGIRKILSSEHKRLQQAGVDGVEEQYLRGDTARAVIGLKTQWHGAGEYGRTKGRARPR